MQSIQKRTKNIVIFLLYRKRAFSKYGSIKHFSVASNVTADLIFLKKHIACFKLLSSNAALDNLKIGFCRMFLQIHASIPEAFAQKKN